MDPRIGFPEEWSWHQAARVQGAVGQCSQTHSLILRCFYVDPGVGPGVVCGFLLTQEGILVSMVRTEAKLKQFPPEFH